MNALRDRLAAAGVSADRLAAIGMTDGPTDTELAAAAQPDPAAELARDAAAVDAFVKYVRGNAFEKSRIRAEVGNVVLEHGRSLLK
jgi:hypothetical protein